MQREESRYITNKLISYISNNQIEEYKKYIQQYYMEITAIGLQPLLLVFDNIRVTDMVEDNLTDEFALTKPRLNQGVGVERHLERHYSFRQQTTNNKKKVSPRGLRIIDILSQRPEDNPIIGETKEESENSTYQTAGHVQNMKYFCALIKVLESNKVGDQSCVNHLPTIDMLDIIKKAIKIPCQYSAEIIEIVFKEYISKKQFLPQEEFTQKEEKIIEVFKEGVANMGQEDKKFYQEIYIKLAEKLHFKKTDQEILKNSGIKKDHEKDGCAIS